MAGGTEHTFLEDFTQCKPQLVSVPLNDSVSLKTVGHPDDSGKSQSRKSLQHHGTVHRPRMVEGLQTTFSPPAVYSHAPINMSKDVL